jgi:uncharacterized protein YjiS (DUF1127 family)
MRWFVHVLARLTIAASCTNSAAALDAQVEHGKHPSFTSSLWEHLMLNSSESANGVARRYSVRGHEFEREIKKAVTALAEFDDRTLRDMGIPHRSQIEQVVRYCRDC